MTETPTETPTASETSSVTPTATETPSATLTESPTTTETASATLTETPTLFPTVSLTATAALPETFAPTATLTDTLTATASPAPALLPPNGELPPVFAPLAAVSGPSYTIVNDVASFLDAIANVNAGLTPADYSLFIASGDYVYNATVRIERSVRIYGGQATILSGSGASFPFFVIGQSATVEFHHVTVRNGRHTFYGAAIWNAGNLSIYDSVIDSNEWPIGGGGIYNSGTGNLNLFRTSFTNNHAGGGGAIQNSGILNVQCSRFDANTADYAGAILNAEYARATIRFSAFEDSNLGLVYGMGNIYNLNTDVQVDADYNWWGDNGFAASGPGDRVLTGNALLGDPTDPTDPHFNPGCAQQQPDPTPTPAMSLTPSLTPTPDSAALVTDLARYHVVPQGSPDIWTYARLETLQRSVRVIARALDRFVHEIEPDDPRTAQELFVEIMAGVDHNVEVWLNQSTHCVTDPYQILCYPQATEYVFTHEFGHQFNYRTIEGGHLGYESAVGNGRAITQAVVFGSWRPQYGCLATAVPVLGTPPGQCDIPLTANDWTRGALVDRGWGSAGALPAPCDGSTPAPLPPPGTTPFPFQQNDCEAPSWLYPTSTPGNQAILNAEVGETAADMFLGWVYQLSELTDPISTCADLPSSAPCGFADMYWLGTDSTGNSCYPNGCNSQYMPGTARFDWMRMTCETILRDHGWIE